MKLLRGFIEEEDNNVTKMTYEEYKISFCKITKLGLKRKREVKEDKNDNDVVKNNINK